MQTSMQSKLSEKGIKQLRKIQVIQCRELTFRENSKCMSHRQSLWPQNKTKTSQATIQNRYTMSENPKIQIEVTIQEEKISGPVT